MGIGGKDTTREDLVATVATALRRSARHSVHPADQASVRLAAARIALALEAEFLVVARHSPAAEPTDRQMTPGEHE